VSLKFLQLLYLFQQHGYLIIFGGTFLEGETTLVLGGLLAHWDYLNFWLVVGTATLASYLGHVVFYFLGKTSASWVLERLPRLRSRIEQAEYLIRRYETLSLFTTQYIFGIRLASALTFGILDMKKTKFLVLQLLSCIIWALIFASIGYWVGESCDNLIKNIEKALLGIIVLGVFLAYLGRKMFDYWFRRRH
jgi:membrane protein DedA with SNARE-associated domain